MQTPDSLICAMLFEIIAGDTN